MSEQWDGRPENPEQDGWHWLATPDGQHRNPVVWHASRQVWCVTATIVSDPPKIAADCVYLGPCRTTADVEAAGRAAVEACIAAVRGYDLSETPSDSPILRALRSLQLNHTLALDARLVEKETAK